MKRNILLVEADPKDQKLTQFMLEQAGYVVKATSDGYSAIDALKTYDFDLALIDIDLPRLTGSRLVSSLLEVTERTPPPIVLIANSEKDPMVKKCLLMGAYEVILKPLERENLLKRVENILGARPQFEELKIPSDIPTSKGDLRVPIEVKSISIKGLVLHSPIEVDEAAAKILLFDLELLRDLKVKPDNLRVFDCVPCDKGWDVYVTFLDLESTEYQSIREWIVTQSYRYRKSS